MEGSTWVVTKIHVISLRFCISMAMIVQIHIIDWNKAKILLLLGAILFSDSDISGPLNIGGKAWWKFPKIWLLCTDEISKICPKMFGLQQAWAPQVKICSDCPSGLKKTQICSDGAIRPRKQAIFRLAIRPQKRFTLPPNDNQIANCTEIKSLGIHTVRITRLAQNTYMPSKI